MTRIHELVAFKETTYFVLQLCVELRDLHFGLLKLLLQRGPFLSLLLQRLLQYLRLLALKNKGLAGVVRLVLCGGVRGH